MCVCADEFKRTKAKPFLDNVLYDLNMNTTPSYRIGRTSEEYSLLALISKENSEKLSTILGSLSNTFPGARYSLKQGQLHITVTAVMRDISFGDRTREEFLTQEDAIIKGINEVVKNYSSFSLHFDQIEATQDALIIKSSDKKILNGLRADVIKRLSIPYPPATIAHSSIARFKSEIPLEDIQNILKEIEIDFMEYITELVLVRETVMPLEKYEVVARFQLS